MTTTRNGFTVVKLGSPHLVTITVGGRKFTVKREAATAFKRLLTFVNAVEPFSEAGYDGGYAYRAVRGNTQAWSEHAAGTAVDVNASQHPMQYRHQYEGWSALQVRMLHWYLATTATGRLFKWGAEFTTRHDPMHFEVRSPELLAAYDKEHVA